jgi:hypothetical protein
VSWTKGYYSLLACRSELFTYSVALPCQRAASISEKKKQKIVIMALSDFTICQG